MFPSKVSWAIITMVISALQREYNCQEVYFENIVTPYLEETGMNFTELAVKYAGSCEEHRILTDDGYILTLFRVPVRGGRPVLIQHGNLGSADDFLIRGPTSLIIALFEAGYDVWVSNIRGNKYSRRHRTLDPDADREFWEFSLQDVVEYDITAMIDHVLARTGYDQLTAIGFSVGTSIFYALGADQPDYNEKINLMISLAPICYMFHSGPLSNMEVMEEMVDPLLDSIGLVEVNGRWLSQNQAQEICAEWFQFMGPTMADAVCLQLRMWYTPGFDPYEIEPEFAPMIAAHFPSSSSKIFIEHLAQIGNNRRFAKFDYGMVENIVRYGSIYPPAYDLSLTDMPIALISAKNDRLSTLEDVELLKPQLGNLVEHILLEPENFDHVDFMWARHSPEILFPYIFGLIEKYT